MQGFWYAPHSSARLPAELIFKHDRYLLTIEGQAPKTGTANSLDVSDRVGNIARKITFEDGSLFETLDNATIDTWLNQIDHDDSRSHTLHILESRWRWIGLALVATIVIVWASIRFGLPWGSEKLAYALPDQANQWIAEGAMESLDEVMFEPSQLSEARQAEIQQHFQTQLVPLQDGKHSYKLLFRYMPEMDLADILADLDITQEEENKDSDTPAKTKPPIKYDGPGVANAFALPSGEIVITDSLIALAKNQAEIDSILLHEMGHVEYRHSLRQLIESSALSLGVLLIIGDPSALNSLLIGLPTFLVNNHYSRTHESEADEYAFKKMLKAKIDPIVFSHIMDRLEKQGLTEAEIKELEDDNGSNVSEYLSTHPNTVERMQNAKRYSEQYQQQVAQ
ncbi:MAG: M48 family metallopeptidase [Thiofilum sp.]|uniref:M48 family metallopeptidase n=1 Tax=Thiofilum sp. TaxID=2212733 RepID=UPI0025CCA210|nr:M48 family metallopeptidase [Thiofilum sp.]MBK8452307.1 M48 family metallopeptidase [Thiofilum sp.]